MNDIEIRKINNWLKGTYLEDAKILAYEMKKDNNKGLCAELFLDYANENIHLNVQDGIRLKTFIDRSKKNDEIDGIGLRRLYEQKKRQV